MRTDAEIKEDGFRVLIDNLGDVDAEKFVRLIIKEPFDYTGWQELFVIFEPIKAL